MFAVVKIHQDTHFLLYVKQKEKNAINNKTTVAADRNHGKGSFPAAAGHPESVSAGLTAPVVGGEVSALSTRHSAMELSSP